jgi:hypothetical protein
MDAKRAQIAAGMRSFDAFVRRRSPVVLASAWGSRLARSLATSGAMP